MSMLPPIQPIAPLWTRPVPISVQTSRLEGLIQQLGSRVQIKPNGMLQFNDSLIQQIVRYGPLALSPLATFLRVRSQNPEAHLPQILEAIYTADQLAEAGVTEVRELYPVVSVFNTHPNPLLQIYLAGFYREINRPETFGPMLTSLVHRAIYQYPQAPATWNISEEVGGALLKQIAQTTAAETVRQLQPWLYPAPSRHFG